MKNLSKILLVILAVALVVSSVATLAFASTVEEENLAMAQSKLQAVVEAQNSATTYAAALADLSLFLSDNQFNTASDEYKALVAEYNHHALACAIVLKDAIPAGELESVSSALNAFLEATKELFFASPAKDKYTGSVNAASAILGRIDEQSDRAELMEVLALTYEYVTANPVNPTDDSYPEFISSYFAACAKLNECLTLPVTQGADVDAKIAALQEIYAYLAKTPVSTELIATYNAARAQLLSEYAGMHESLSSPDMQLPEIQVVDPDYSSAAQLQIRLKAVSNALEATYASDFEKWTEVATKFVYAYEWVMTNEIDPANETSVARIQTYIELRNSIGEEILSFVDSKTDLAEKLQALTIVRDFLTAAPITDAVVDAYNERVASLTELCLDLAADMVEEDMFLEYIAPAKKEINVSFATFKTLLADFDNAKDTAGRKAAIKALYNLVKVAVFDTANAEYGVIKAAYNEKAAALTAELLAVESASELADVREFLNETPYTAAAIAAYNAKVSELVFDADEAAALKLTTPLLTLGELLDATLAAENATLRQAAYAVVDAYLKSVSVYDMDNDYQPVFAKQAEVYALVVEELFASVDAAVGVSAKYETLKTVKNYLVAIENTKEVIEEYNAIAEDFVSVCQNAALTLSSDFKAIVSLPDKLTSLLGEVEAAETFEAKMQAFAVLYAAYTASNGDENDPAYLAFVETFDQYAVSFATDLIALVDAETTPADKIVALKSINEYLKQNLFSQDVIDKYNVKLAELKGLDYGVYAERVAAETTECSYTSDESLVTDFSQFASLVDALNAALTGTTDEETETTTVDFGAVCEAYTAVYNYLSTNVVDMLATGYTAEVVAKYDAARTAMVSAINAYISGTVDNPETPEDEVALAYQTVYAYLEEDAMSVKFVAAYNSLRKNNSNIKNLASKFKDFKTAFTTFENHYLTNAVIDKSQLSEEDIALYDALTLEVNRIVNVYLSASLLTYRIADFVDPDYALIAKNAEIDRAKIVMSKYPSAPTQSIRSQISSCQRDLVSLTDAQKAAVEDTTNLEEYNWKRTIRDFATGSNPYSFANSSKTKDTSYIDLPTSADGNRYLALNYNSQSGPYIEFRLTETEKLDETTKGVVIEFDYMATPGAVTSFGCTEDGLDDSGNKTGVRNAYAFFTIKNGSLYVSSVLNKAAENAFNYGEWTHVALVVHSYGLTDTLEYEIYIDYVHVGTYTDGTSQGDNAKLTRLRIQNTVKYQQVCFDNVECYNGTAYRTEDRFDKMSESEQFKFYVDYMQNEKYTSVNRAYAYNEAYNLLESARQNAALASYVDALLNTDYDSTILVAAKRERMAELVELSAPLFKQVNASNYGAFQMDVDRVDAFLADNGPYFDQTSEEFINIRNRLSKVKSEIARVSALEQLVDALTKFERATTVASMTRHFAEVKTAYELCSFKEGSNYADAMEDPIVKNFLKTVPVYDPDFGLKEYYEEYSHAKIDAQSKIENSIRIIKCIGIIEAMEGYEATEEYWNANYDYIEHYMYIIRVIVQNGEYDAKYDGIDVAMEKYVEIENYFYYIVKDRNIALIEEYLGKYITASSYIEKRGICAYVDNYIVDNGIDVNDADFAALVRILEAYKLELNQYESEYAAILEANTIAFLGIVDKMGAYVTYSELKPLYAEAIEKYYYNMNVDAEATKAALLKFAEYENFIESAEENARNLIAAAKEVSSARNSKQLFKALVECSAFVENAETDIAGVSAALATYEAKLAEYNAVINPLNQQISETNSVVCASRGTSIAATVLAIIKAIFS